MTMKEKNYSKVIFNNPITIIILVILGIAGLYFAGVYTVYGIDIAIHPNYDLESGCPLNATFYNYSMNITIFRCDDSDKMMCPKNDMTGCYIMGIIMMVAIMISFGIVIMAILLIGLIIQELGIYILRVFEDCTKKKIISINNETTNANIDLDVIINDYQEKDNVSLSV
jgi:hypothetical protein